MRLGNLSGAPARKAIVFVLIMTVHSFGEGCVCWFGLASVLPVTPSRVQSLDKIVVCSSRCGMVIPALESGSASPDWQASNKDCSSQSPLLCTTSQRGSLLHVR